VTDFVGVLVMGAFRGWLSMMAGVYARWGVVRKESRCRSRYASLRLSHLHHGCPGPVTRIRPGSDVKGD
jgi:hypothetical protein